jgi:hypothetical protein
VLGRRTRRIDPSPLWIDPDDVPAIGRETDRQNAWPSPDVEETPTSIKTELLCNG